jgi:hypothetical protein
MVRNLRIQYPGALYDVMNWGDQRETLFGDWQARVCGLVSATGERNRQVQSEAQGRPETNLINPFMKSRRAYAHAFAGLAFILVSSCASDPGPSTSGVSREGDNQLPVIGHVEFRDQMVTILSGSNGPLYTVTAKDGQRLAAQLGELELHARFPDLYQKMKASMAANDARRF